ncbi:hypothetical protein ASPZODRAFT_69305 [Penicilliopsis zonata CBS 506.65]|uniref:Autophagy-related protein 27 n=1 Tax=Penicilliopsis zonata CBS 506.65 TaxID=1073090 RepID=A0A1L9SEB1_9EURO|nr:hypothetical protein ASPZODRAFT_69305 [Penicilliopsis zonata CBS 506.65]OJJ45570.1 hypothetical protein ASPZODRAFT_69305 [Penicilliopsis zonata CBS 506.65]
MQIRSGLFLFGSLLGVVSASGFDCQQIVADGFKYDLSPLGGVHEVYNLQNLTESVVNTTYVLNICNILKGASIRDKLKCGTSKNICGFRYEYDEESEESAGYAFPVAGLDHLGHGTKDPEITRLKKLDPDEEGLMVKLAGGEYSETHDPNDKKKKDVSAVIQFKCDPDRTGLERLTDAREEEKRGDPAAGDNNEGDRSLQFKSFGASDDGSYVLRLDWRTRYACDDYLKQKKEVDSSSSWGFFTWFIIIAFLCTAAYLIFGSWLNYTRYGARGWDLLPHGDTIRDLPYIFQDWLRRVINTFQGSGSRGGYSAV